jgi:hypothetical protein
MTTRKLPPLAERHPGLTGIKDVDLKILSELNDKDLFSFCLVDKHANRLCKDENFWRNRFFVRFGQNVDNKNNKKWRDFYLEIVSKLGDYENPWDFFHRIRWFINNPQLSSFYYRRQFPEEIKYPLKFLQLGKEIILYFPIGTDYDTDETFYTKRVYTSDTDFTPEKVLQIVYDFYQEPITEEEYDQINEQEYTLEEVQRGEIPRVYLRPRIISFRGFTPYKDGYALNID